MKCSVWIQVFQARVCLKILIYLTKIKSNGQVLSMSHLRTTKETFYSTTLYLPLLKITYLTDIQKYLITVIQIY